MKILYVVSRAVKINSSSSIRNISMIKGLISLGNKVTVISCAYDDNNPYVDESLQLQGAEEIYIDINGIQSYTKIGRGNPVLEPLRRRMRYCLNRFVIYDSQKSMSRYVDIPNVDYTSFDLIISSSDPKSSHLFVEQLRRRNKLKDTKWVQIWGDPFADDITRSGFIYKKRAQKEEERLFNNASKIVYVSSITCEQQKKKYKKYANIMEYCPPAYISENTDEHRQTDGPLKIAYCGNYNKIVRDIEPFYRAICKTEHQIFVYGNGEPDLKSSERITIKKRCSFKEIKDLEANVDILVYLCNKKGGQLPGKIYQYMGTCKYILFILDGDKRKTKALFDKYNRFVFCDNKEDDILSAIRRIEQGKEADTCFIVKEFSPEKIAEKFLKIIGEST